MSNTLFFVAIYVEAILGLMLLFVWSQNTSVYAAMWWGFAELLRAGSIALFGLYGLVSNLISIDLANAILFTTFAVDLQLERACSTIAGRASSHFGQRGSLAPGLAHTGFANSFDVRVFLGSGIITAYIWATAFEFWRGRSEPLISRWPAIFLLFAHGSLYLLRTPIGATLLWGQTGTKCSKAFG